MKEPGQQTGKKLREAAKYLDKRVKSAREGKGKGKGTNQGELARLEAEADETWRVAYLQSDEEGHPYHDRGGARVNAEGDG